MLPECRRLGAKPADARVEGSVLHRHLGVAGGWLIETDSAVPLVDVNYLNSGVSI